MNNDEQQLMPLEAKPTLVLSYKESGDGEFKTIPVESLPPELVDAVKRMDKMKQQMFDAYHQYYTLNLAVTTQHKLIGEALVAMMKQKEQPKPEKQKGKKDEQKDNGK
jgi:hypothetical protein